MATFTSYKIPKMLITPYSNLATATTQVKPSVSHLFVSVSNLISQSASVCRVSSELEPQTPDCLDAH